MAADISRSQALGPILIACLTAAALCLLTVPLTGVWPHRMLIAYIASALWIAPPGLCIWAFVKLVPLAKARADRPLAILAGEISSRAPMLLLPLLIFPTFLAFYTTAKLGVPAIAGFAADPMLADLERALLGTDAWTLTHSILGPTSTHLIDIAYVPIWIGLTGYVQLLVPLFGSRRFAATLALAMMLTWLIGGFVVAYLLPSAGPIFAHLVSPEFGDRFAALHPSLRELAPPGSYMLQGIDYLHAGLADPGAMAGTGISAMPSMHVATVAIFWFAARGSVFAIPAAIFAAIIFVGSIHSGYHYALDGAVSALIAWGCWRISSRLFARMPSAARAATALPA